MIVGIRAGRSERSRSSEKVLEDISEAALGRNPSYRQQLKSGTEVWRTRIDAASGMDGYGQQGLAVGDYDRDGLPDLFVANDFGHKNLYRNQGDGRFRDVTAEAGIEGAGAGMSVVLGDYVGDGWEAEPLLEKASEWKAYDSESWYTLAMTYLHAGRANRAVGAFSNLFQVDPSSLQALALAAGLMLQEHRLQDAESMLRKALALEPDLPGAPYDLGVIALRRGDHAEASALLRQELLRDPGERGRVAFDRRSYSRARRPSRVSGGAQTSHLARHTLIQVLRSPRQDLH